MKFRQKISPRRRREEKNIFAYIQCDQIVWLSAQYLAIYNNALPNSKKVAKIGRNFAKY